MSHTQWVTYNEAGFDYSRPPRMAFLILCELGMGFCILRELEMSNINDPAFGPLGSTLCDIEYWFLSNKAIQPNNNNYDTS